MVSGISADRLREQERDDDDRDGEDVHQVGVGDLAHVIGGRRVTGDPVCRGTRLVGHPGDRGTDGRDLVQRARLVADGLTNKQIGARLFISERTVDSHVRSILNKLGVGSRAQIAAWVATLDP